MNLLLLILALVLSVIVFTIGLIVNIIMAWKVKDFWEFVKNITVQVGLTFYNLFFILAKWVDVMGNVIGGTAFKVFFIKKEYRKLTLYGKANITISVATGHSLKNKYFTEKGVKLPRGIDWAFGENHCSNAYKKYEYIKNFNNK